MSVKTIITDLDGTLLMPDGSIGEYTLDIFQRLREKNIDIHIATGRPLSGALITTTDLITAPEMAVYNGSQLYHRDDSRLLQKMDLAQEVVWEAMEFLENEGVDYFVYHDEIKHMRPGKLEEISHKLTDFFFGVEIVKDHEKIPTHNCPRLACWTHDDEAYRIVKHFSSYPNVHVESFPFSAIETFPKEDLHFVEMQFASEGKVELMRYLERERGVAIKDVVVFGDQNNDLGMLKVAGYSYAVANAFDECFEVANEKIGSNAEEAVAKKLEELFLK